MIRRSPISAPRRARAGRLTLVALASLALAFVLVASRARRAGRNAQRADEALRSLRTLLAAAPMAFVAWNRERGVVLWSDSAERMFGTPRGRVLGAPLPESLRQLRDEVEHALTATEAPIGLSVNLRNEQGELMHLSVSASRMELQIPGESTIAAVIEDMTSHRLREARRIDAVRAQRDALIREVHHRIKNHLQGVAGLLRQHLAGKPLLQPLLEAATAQVLTIAAVHGLQGELAGRALDLRSMVSRIAASISGIMHVPIVLGDTCADLEGTCMAEEEAVPIAMVLNEILMNAVKHRARDGTDALIRVGAERGNDSVSIRISNQGFLPPRFDLASGIQVGTGLGLAKSLLPQEGARLHIAEAGDLVVATLTVSELHLCFADTSRHHESEAMEA
jgi:PAS domain S-box-containing protein